MKKLNQLTIGEASKRSGLPVSTLRYYEEKGLIKSIGRDGVKRVFNGNIIEQLSLIALARYAGFSLIEIAKMFSPSGKPRINREQLLEKADELNRTIKKFKAMRDGLIHVANCPKTNQLDCLKFQKLVRNAAKIQKIEGKRR